MVNIGIYYHVGQHYLDAKAQLSSRHITFTAFTYGISIEYKDYPMSIQWVKLHELLPCCNPCVYIPYKSYITTLHTNELSVTMTNHFHAAINRMTWEPHSFVNLNSK